MLSDMGMMMNRRRVCGGKKGLLPSGYKQLEYIENTSNAYILLPALRWNGIKVDVDFYVDVNTQGSGIVHGRLNDGALRQQNFQIGTAFSNAYLRFDYGNDRVEGNISYTNKRIFFKQDANKIKTYYNDNLYNSLTINRAPESNTVSPLVVMGCMIDSIIDSYHIKGKLYYLHIFTTDNVELNFIPCINPNNVVGMYDTVGEQFYSSPNGTAFIAGPEV